jgi:myosin heavy subunit
LKGVKEKMRFSNSALNCGIIIYICAFLAVGPLVGSVSAKITHKQVDEEVGFIVIEKGDTLWDLAEEYYNDPYLWKRFKKYNEFTNPDLIYPNEKLQVPIDIARKMKSDIVDTMAVTKDDIKELKEKYDKHISEFESTSRDIKDMKMTLANLREECKSLKNQVSQQEEHLENLLDKMEEKEENCEKVHEQVQRLKDLLESRETEKLAVEREIKGLEEKLDETYRQIQMREEKVDQLSKEIKEHNEKLAMNQENFVKLQKKIEEAEIDLAKEAEKPSDKKSSKIALITTIASGVVIFVASAIAR